MDYNGRDTMGLKVVYWGPGRSGKTTNLEKAHELAPQDSVGELEIVTTEGDRTIFYDSLPMDVAERSGIKVRFSYYTVPGQAKYAQTRFMVLSGVDGVVFVADSSPAALEANKESMDDLFAQLRKHRRDPSEIPIVIQFNKRDVEDALSLNVLQEALNPLSFPTIIAVACEGNGVASTMETICNLTMDSVAAVFDSAERRESELKRVKRSQTRMIRRRDIIRRISQPNSASSPPKPFDAVVSERKRTHVHLADAEPAEDRSSDVMAPISDSYAGNAKTIDADIGGLKQSASSSDETGMGSKTRMRLDAQAVKKGAQQAAAVTKQGAAEMVDDLQRATHFTVETVGFLPKRVLLIFGLILLLILFLIILIFVI